MFAVIAVFAFNKLYLRPKVLAADAPYWVDVLVLSFPNFCEAVIGTLFLCIALLSGNDRWLAGQLPPRALYVLATLFAALYVLTQEYRWHNLGGNNIFDPFDVVFSLLGLMFALVLLFWLQPKVRQSE